MADPTWPIEVRSIGRTLSSWRHEIVAWHDQCVSNGPAETSNNLVKRIKRIGFSFTNFENYRMRALLTPVASTGHCSTASLLADLRRAGKPRLLAPNTVGLRENSAMPTPDWPRSLVHISNKPNSASLVFKSAY